MDGDNTHDPKYIIDMVDKIQDGYDVVIASRYTKNSINSDIPYRRKYWVIFQLYFRILFRIKNVKEYTCGYRAYSLIIQKVKKFGNNFIQIKGLGFFCTRKNFKIKTY